MRKKHNPSEQPTGKNITLGVGEISRRSFLTSAGATIVTVAAGASATMLGLGAINQGKRPSLGDQATIETEPKPLETIPAPSDTEVQGTIVTAETIPPDNTQPIIPEATPELTDVLLIQPESLQEGEFLGSFNVVSATGRAVVPEVSLLANLSSDQYNSELDRGAILEVRRVGMGGREDPATQQGVLGDTRRITTIFGHRMTTIGSEDINQDGVVEPKRRVFEKLDQVDLGSVMTITLKDGTTVRYICSEEKIYENAQLLKEGGDPNKARDFTVSNPVIAGEIRYQDTVVETIQLVACHPPGQVKDRITRVFTRLTD